MKLLKRNASLAVIALLSAPVFFSCSSNQLQSSKSDFTNNELAFAQTTMPKAENAIELVQVGDAVIVNEAKNQAIELNSKPLVVASAQKAVAAKSEKKASTKLMFSKNPTQEKAPSIRKQKINKSIAKVMEMADVNKAKASGKSQLIALILAGLIGWLGIHRFYLGYIWQGIVFILLALTSFLILPGIALFIWLLIDIIRIIMGKLKPKDGEYSSTFSDM